LQTGCGKSEALDDIPALGHNWQWVVTTPPNFIAGTDGEETGSCARNCGVSDTTQEYPCYSIGDTGPGGGIIFYVADGQAGRSLGFTVQGYTGATAYLNFATYTAYYLEAAPPSAITNFTNIGMGVYANHSSVLGDTSPDLGTGRRNTHFFISVQGTGNQWAPQLCYGFTNNSISDWFLPSRAELRLIWDNIQNQSRIYREANHWTSSEREGGYIQIMALNNGIGGATDNFNLSINAIPIRAF